MTVIAVLNESSDVTDALARRMTKACHRQIERDVAKLWYLEPWPVRFYKSEASVPKDSLAIVILDNKIAADALGYHFETPAGLRYGRVFAKPILDGGTIHSSPLSVSTVLSHEVIESFIDPDINLWAEGVPGVMWAYEACDPVERDTYRIRVDGRLVFVSNFVLPSWFDRENPKSFNHRWSIASKIEDPTSQQIAERAAKIFGGDGGQS